MYQGYMGPRYIIAFSVNCGTIVLAILSATVLRFILVNLNSKLDRGEHVDGAVTGVGSGEVAAAADRGFRFVV